MQMEDEAGAGKSLEVRIPAALRARLNDFKDKADTLTLEGVRRVLEKDLGLKAMELDSHKKFIKQCMDKYFYEPTESTKHSEENSVETAQSGRNAESQTKSSRPKSEFEDRKGLLSSSEDTKNAEGLDEGVVKKAIQKHAAYLRENSGNITMAGVRRFLEEDLNLGRKSLDKYKDFIGKQLDEILSSEVVEAPSRTNKSKLKKSASSQDGKRNKKSESTFGPNKSANSDDVSNSTEPGNSTSDSDSEEVEVKESKIRNAHERMSAQVPKRQKISSKTSGPSSSGRKKTEECDVSNDSEGNLSDSTMEESSKKKREIPTPVYGKKVEHLKSVIKACGMSVPPSVYKRAKQAPDDKREAFLIKELEGVLEKEGLSRNPSEKDIKAVRKNKERAKELEGIDLSNIVSSSRRRTTASFIPSKPPMPLDESEEEEEEEEEDTDDENSQSGGSSEGFEEEEETSD